MGVEKAPMKNVMALFAVSLLCCYIWAFHDESGVCFSGVQLGWLIMTRKKPTPTEPPSSSLVCGEDVQGQSKTMKHLALQKQDFLSVAMQRAAFDLELPHFSLSRIGSIVSEGFCHVKFDCGGFSQSSC